MDPMSLPPHPVHDVSRAGTQPFSLAPQSQVPHDPEKCSDLLARLCFALCPSLANGIQDVRSICLKLRQRMWHFQASVDLHSRRHGTGAFLLSYVHSGT